MAEHTATVPNTPQTAPHANGQPTFAEQLAALQAKLDAREAESKADKARIERLEAERKREGTLSFKVGEKGGMSMYGLGRWPVTLYRSQWTRVIEACKNGTVERKMLEFGTALKEKPAPGQE